MPGDKTHEQQQRAIKNQPDYPDERQVEAERTAGPDAPPHRAPKEGVRQSEHPVSRQGMHQESRHNKGSGSGGG